MIRLKKQMIAGGIVCLALVLAMCGMQEKQPESEEADLQIWYPGGYEILYKKELNDIEAIQEMEKRLGVSINFSGVTGKLDSAFQTQMLDLAGVDAVFYRFSAQQLRTSWENGQILDYTDKLSWMPHLQERFRENPLLYQYASIDGKCLFFPSIIENHYQDILLAVRQDWKEQAGISEICTLEELTDLYRSQKEAFEAGMLTEQGKYFVGFSSYNGYVDQLQRIFGTDQGVYWNEDRDALIYGPATEEYRSYLIFLKDLYQEELLDAHLYETDATNFEKYFLNGMSSSILTTGEHAARLEDYALANGDDIFLEYLNLDTFQGESPAIYRTSQRQNQVLEFGFVINAEIEPEKLTQLLAVIDYLYSEEGMELMNWGLEGTHWVFQDGMRVYCPELLKSQESYAAAMAPYVKQDMLCIDREVNWNMLDEELRSAVSESSYEKDYSFDKPRGYYTQEEQERLEILEVNLSTFVEETSMNFIYRSIDPAEEKDWQDYLDTLKEFGMAEYLEIQENASRRMQQRQYEE